MGDHPCTNANRSSRLDRLAIEGKLAGAGRGACGTSIRVACPRPDASGRAGKQGRRDRQQGRGNSASAKQGRRFDRQAGGSGASDRRGRVQSAATSIKMKVTDMNVLRTIQAWAAAQSTKVKTRRGMRDQPATGPSPGTQVVSDKADRALAYAERELARYRRELALERGPAGPGASK